MFLHRHQLLLPTRTVGIDCFNNQAGYVYLTGTDLVGSTRAPAYSQRKAEGSQHGLCLGQLNWYWLQPKLSHYMGGDNNSCVPAFHTPPFPAPHTLRVMLINGQVSENALMTTLWTGTQASGCLMTHWILVWPSGTLTNLDRKDVFVVDLGFDPVYQ